MGATETNVKEPNTGPMEVKNLKCLYSEKTIQRRVGAIADQINRDYASQEVVLVGILKGAFVFLADLARKLTISPCIDFIWLSSYGNATASSGSVEIIKDLETEIEGKHVLIVEDILDTGLTLEFLKHELEKRHPRSLKTCVFLDKKFRRMVDVEPDYVGMMMDKDYFVVGYGLDCAEHYRHLPGIYAIEP